MSGLRELKIIFSTKKLIGRLKNYLIGRIPLTRKLLIGILFFGLLLLWYKFERSQFWWTTIHLKLKKELAFLVDAYDNLFIVGASIFGLKLYLYKPMFHPKTDNQWVQKLWSEPNSGLYLNINNFLASNAATKSRVRDQFSYISL